MFCISPMFMTSDNDFETALRLNRSKYSKNLIFSYLNINSSQGGYSRYFIAAQTKTQFTIGRYHKPLSLDATNKIGGLLVYVT